MSDAIISVEGLGKKYRIKHQAERQRYVALRDVLASKFKGLFRNRTAEIGNRKSVEDFWALQDVSFEVKQGDLVGIIGRNGAGKSTLLKILSRITEPTAGRVRIVGRMGSLLEVGTGFHPELTGRENIYLNGIILGMRKREIDRKFDEIVAFSEIEKFLDTPVKRYSSGMYVRLAFSVAAHLEPDILLVDEVLAVGDAAFQKKCLGKMDEVSKGGRTVLFVSHNMSHVLRVCQKGILLERGRIRLVGSIGEVTSQYLKSDSDHGGQRVWEDPATAPGDATARLRSIRVVSRGKPTDLVNVQDPVTIEMEFWNHHEGENLMSAFSFFNSQGVFLFVAADLLEPEWGDKPRPAGLHRTRCTIPGGLFNEGLVSVVAEVSTRAPVYHMHFLEYDAVAFQVVDDEAPGSLRTVWSRELGGAVRPMSVWQDWRSEFIGSGIEAEEIFAKTK